MGTNSCLQRGELCLRLLDLRLVDPLNILIQLIKHIVKASRDLTELIIPLILNPCTKITTSYFAGKFDNTVRPFGEINNKERREQDRDQYTDR
ncbi:hypothetical protein D3C85_1309220 [compost metagenome]